MKKLYVDLAKNKIDNKEWLSKKAMPNDDPVIDEDVVVIDKSNNEVLLIYKNTEEEVNTEGMIEALSKVKFPKDERTNGLITQSETIGYRPRMMGLSGKKTCSKTTFGNKYKDIEDELFNIAHIAERLYSEYAPSRYQNHSSMAQQVRGEYLMPETNFTSGIINKNNPLKYHLDTGNFKNVFSIMLGLKKHVRGGYLHIPELKINLKVDNGSLSMFDGQRFVHGVTPIIGSQKESYRFTIVFYSLVQMWRCLETAAEVENAKSAEDKKLAKLLERIQKEKDAVNTSKD